MSGTIPDRLGKYEIRSVLGRGAMGIVYDSWDPVIERRVAIKTVRLPDAQDQEAIDSLDRFKREAQAAGRLTHANIVGVFDYGETDTVAYIVMEFVEGQSLKAILDADQRLPAADALRVMRDVLAGLAYSHGRGVIHRDIKPANIIITPDNQAKIADFGIARIEASSMTQAGTVMGTPAYMSPEQFMGQPVDVRTDIYSCGIMLYQLLAGERPYEGSMTSIMHKAMTTSPPKPSELAVTAPVSLDPVVARAMARRPEDRFASAAEFASALSDPLPARPESDADATIVASRAAPIPQPPPPRPKPNRLPLVMAACVILAAIGAAAFFLRPTEQQPRLASVTPPVPTSPQPAAPLPIPDAKPNGTAPLLTAPSPTVAPAIVAPPTDAPPTVAPPVTAPIVPAPSAAPSPLLQQDAAATPPSLSLPPSAAPVLTPVMASPPPNPATISCSLVQTTPAGTTALVSAQSRPTLQQALPDIQPRLVDEAFCPVLDLFRRLGSAPGSALVVAQDGGPTALHDNQVIALHAIMPGFAGFLHVTYVQHDQTVAPLVPGPGYPNQTYPARGTIALGNPRRDSPGWLVGPPFGTDMIVAIASTAPLFQQPLPNDQSLEAYLSALQTAIEALRRRGGTVAVTAVPIETLSAPSSPGR